MQDGSARARVTHVMDVINAHIVQNAKDTQKVDKRGI